MPAWTRAAVRVLDGKDSLAPLKKLFPVAAGLLYFNGNSLGLLSQPAEHAVRDVLEVWKSIGVDGWFTGSRPWLGMMDKVSAQVAPLVGADPREVTTANSTTVNLHQLLSTLYRPKGAKRKILVDETIFCSDLYAIQSHLRLRGLDPVGELIIVPTVDGVLLSEETLAQRMSDDVAYIVLPSVVYHTGQLLDMKRLVEEAHRRNIVIGFDCSHSVGCVPHELSRWGADFAFWGGYKYLNGGPGAVGGLYLNQRHFGRAPGLAGWFGCTKDRFLEMNSQFDPAHDAESLQISTPFVLSMAPLLGSLSIISEAGIGTLRAKSLQLNRLLMDLVDARLRHRGVSMITPREDHRRGGHVALAYPEAEALCRMLHERQVIADYRRPDILRLCPSPLYTSFEDCLDVIERLESIMESNC
ncbi:MAG TPA: kynureninase [Planctomycetaceae bacterium]|jgi:kynureninase|nr:kynureninase [Planctomycetaceae bacterium]